jgi:hypothetical protein
MRKTSILSDVGVRVLSKEERIQHPGNTSGVVPIDREAHLKFSQFVQDLFRDRTLNRTSVSKSGLYDKDRPNLG